MTVSKEIVKKLRKFTKNGDTTQMAIAEFCGTGQANISRLFKYNECSRPVYERILEFIPMMDRKLEQRRAREQKLLKTA